MAGGKKISSRVGVMEQDKNSVKALTTHLLGYLQLLGDWEREEDVSNSLDA